MRLLDLFQMHLKYSIFDNSKLELLTTTREEGVSVGSFSSMNLCFHSGDSVDNVRENRELLANRLAVPVHSLFIPYQTHEDQVKHIDCKFLNLPAINQEKELYGVDALITQEKGIAIGVTTADCVPISIYDPVNHALGVAHAGWKGTVAKIGAKTVERMIETFGTNPSDLLVGIGPSISQEMFEVGDEVGDAFTNAGFALDKIAFRKPETGKLHIDLWLTNLLSLLEVGVERDNMEISGICTFKSENFFSARRQTIKSGRMFTGGVLK